MVGIVLRMFKSIDTYYDMIRTLELERNTDLIFKR